MEVVVQRHACHTLESKTSEVDIDTVLPALSWLEGERLAYVFDMRRELIEANGMRVVADIFVEERITEASCATGLARYILTS